MARSLSRQNGLLDCSRTKILPCNASNLFIYLLLLLLSLLLLLLLLLFYLLLINVYSIGAENPGKGYSRKWLRVSKKQTMHSGSKVMQRCC